MVQILVHSVLKEAVRLTLKNPNIKIQILICYPYTFSIEVVGRIC